jgi:hypothetical protein
MRFCPRPLHRSEIMTSGWCGGDRVGCGSLQFRRKPSRQGPVRRSSRYHARAAQCGATQGAKPGTHEPGGSNEGGAGIPAADRVSHRSRDAAGDAPRPWWHRPKTPAGRRGVSLFHSRTTASGQTPRRSRFVCPKGQSSLKLRSRMAVGRISVPRSNQLHRLSSQRKLGPKHPLALW